MIQYLIVGLVVLLATFYSAWVLMPASWRRAGAAKLAARATRSGLDAHAAHELRLRLERASGCSDCASCKGCSAAKPGAATRD
jgi:alkylhydroperoxidase family enzyme